jgi:selenocysteine lyase/cysteine desulfurase
MDKRSFLKTIPFIGSALTFSYPNLDKLMKVYHGMDPKDLAHDETFWAEIRSGYRLKPDYINLENGYYCLIPQETLENQIHHLREINYQGSWYMRTVQWENDKIVRTRLAEMLGASVEEVAVTRNTTESLDTVIGGFPWEEGDEAIMAEQDYFSMLHMFKLQAQRKGIVNKVISIPNHPGSDQEIVDLYASQITERTKMIMVCHMINITGHILPVRKICDMAHSRGIEVLVDGAHAVGHIQVNIPDLDCDYYGSSLHKWLSAPLGSGLLYVKKNKIDKLWPLFAHLGRAQGSIERINHRATHSIATDLAIINAIEYYDRIGHENKQARLGYIQRYWSDQVRDYPGITVNTPKESHKSCGIANVGIDGMKPKDMANQLLEKYRIWTVAIDGVGVHGCRISPNIYTNLKELDKFVIALKEMADA